MNYQVSSNVYKTPDGAATFDSSEGKNELVLVAGAVVSEDEAKRLKLPELDVAAAQNNVKAHLSDLAPFVPPVTSTPTAPTEVGAELPPTTQGTQRLDSDFEHNEPARPAGENN